MVSILANCQSYGVTDIEDCLLAALRGLNRPAFATWMAVIGEGGIELRLRRCLAKSVWADLVEQGSKTHTLSQNKKPH
jgi:hypothetical protein